VSNKELLEVFDAEGHLVGLFPRNECHKNKELAHRAVHILVFNSKGDILLQKRSAKKDLYPLMWDTSVGGHLSPKESYLDAAARECEEELGFRPRNLVWLYRYTMFAENETELVETFFTIYDGPYTPCGEEVLEVKPFSVEELFKEDVKSLCSPFFLKELEVFKNFLKERGFFHEGDNNWWRRHVWERFIAHIEGRKD